MQQEGHAFLFADLMCGSSLHGQWYLLESVIVLHAELGCSSYSLGYPRRPSSLEALANQVRYSLDPSLCIMKAKRSFRLSLVTKTDSDVADQMLTMKRNE